jgi:hypothetical protein
VGELAAAHIVGSEDRDRGVLACFAIVVTHLLAAPMINLFFFSIALDHQQVEFLDKVDMQSRRQPAFLYVRIVQARGERVAQW